MATKTLPKIKPPKSTAAVPMKLRAVKIDDETWDAAMAKAKDDGIAVAEVVRHYLREYAGIK